MCLFLLLIFAVFLIPSSVQYQQWRSIYHKITQEPEFSGFYDNMIKKNRIAKSLLFDGSVTIFAPTNEAVDDHDGKFTDDLILYHMGVDVKTLKNLKGINGLRTFHDGNPPLWITINDGIYVNNAKIIEEKSDYLTRNRDDQYGKNQVLHVIDRVLDPMIDTPFTNATANDFLGHSYKWKIGPWRISSFQSRIELFNKEKLYRKKGGHTFFIPINDKIDDHRLNSIDSYIIDGHVIPYQVLFTRSTERNFIFETVANGDYVYIVLSFITMHGRDYVRSYTVLGDSNHKKGEMIAEIVKADIPVTNGVVHLISQPLAVFDRELKPFPYLPVLYKVSADPTLNLTYNLGEQTKLNDLLKTRNTSVFYTYFAPRDRAWSDFTAYNRREMATILGRHVIVSNGRLTMAKLSMLSKNDNGTTITTLSGPVEINVMKEDDGYVIIWNHRRIQVYRPDYECSDGTVHIINGVFADYRKKNKKHGTFWATLKMVVT